MRFKGLITCAFLLLAAFAADAQENKITMMPVNYDGLKQEVLRHRGKVLVVDFWGAQCLPCKKALPLFIEMHKKYADQGLIVITVSVDNPPDLDKKVELATDFLKQANSPFVNLHLTDPFETWQKKVALETMPCYYIFDRHGRWIRFGGSAEASVNYDELEDTVKQMLKEK